MPHPMIRIHNTETDEVIDREMTDAENATHLQDMETVANREAEATAKATARLALLQRLGITGEEAELLK